MAIPIAPTPVLEGQDAADFLKRIARERTEKRPLTQTPKLESMRDRILANARSGKK